MNRKPKIREPYTAAELRLINACLVALQSNACRESEPARLSLEVPPEFWNSDEYTSRQNSELAPLHVTAYRMK